MRRAVTIVLIGLLAAAPLIGCSRDGEDRGLAPDPEVSSPYDPAAMEETQEERQEKVTREEMAQDVRNFDAAEEQAREPK
jgi:hypothetical protein